MSSKFFRLTFILGTIFLFLTGSAAAQIFDAPWRAFDTGTINEVFAPVAFAVGDIDGDNDVDAVVGNRLSSRAGLSILKNRGDGTYDPPVTLRLPTNDSVGGIALADFDADGDRDVLATIPVAFGSFTKIYVWRNNGDGTLATYVQFPTGSGPQEIIAADYDADGKADLAVFRNGFWYIQKTSSGFAATQFGISSDAPVPSAFQR